MLPLGVQGYRKLRKLDCRYVDKTAYIQELCSGGQYCFLSRPRRFGKSLFVNTLKELFEGNERLFRGLHIHGAWDWSVQHPVIRLSFGYGDFHDSGYVHMHVLEQLADIAEGAGVESPHETGPRRVADHTKLGNALAASDLAGLEARLRAVFASIPSDWHRRNRIARYEGYCAAVVHAWFTARELDVVAEDSGSGGRADLVVRHPNAVSVFEFKVAETARQGTALAQITAGGCAEKYLGQGRPVYLVGVEFGSESRNVERFDSARIQ